MKATIAILVAVAALIGTAPADANAANYIYDDTYVGNGHWGGYGIHGRGHHRHHHRHGHGHGYYGGWSYGYGGSWGGWYGSGSGYGYSVIVR